MLTVAEIIRNSRALAVDRLGPDLDPAFTDAEILEAANIIKNDFFGMRPEAFAVNEIVVQPPSDLRDYGALGFNGLTNATFTALNTELGATLTSGTVSLFKSSISPLRASLQTSLETFSIMSGTMWRLRF